MSRFHAKILLFGEYSLLYNSMALAVPFNKFSGELKIGELKTTDKQQSNDGLYQFLQFQKRQDAIDLKIDFERFEKDISEGLYFDSTIPLQYGVGSSGALVAAVYDRYILPQNNFDRFDPESLTNMKRQLSSIESFFHGQSSGIDPLTSYLNQPILINEYQEVELLSDELNFTGNNINLFLVDTGKKADTASFMEYFIQQSANPAFSKQLSARYIPVVNNSIKALLENASGNFWESLRIISEFQLEYFRPMFPEKYIAKIKEGLESGDFYLKLCGSGGGGYLLGFSNHVFEDYYLSI